MFLQSLKDQSFNFNLVFGLKGTDYKISHLAIIGRPVRAGNGIPGDWHGPFEMAVPVLLESWGSLLISGMNVFLMIVRIAFATACFPASGRHR
jgi:hypothetical protein